MRRTPLVGRFVLGLAVVATVLAGVVAAPGASAREIAPLFEHGLGWHPCMRLTLRADDSGQPGSTSIASLLPGVARTYNDAVGRRLLRAGPPLRPGARSDTYEIPVRWGEDVGHRGAAGQASVTARGGFIERAAIDLAPPAEPHPGSREQLRRTLLHELGHALGLSHVVDARDVMSYGWFADPADGLGPGTTAALRRLYRAPCHAAPVLRDAPVDWHWTGPPSQPKGHPLPVSEEASHVTWGGDARDLVGLSAAIASELGAADRFVICRDDLAADCLAGAPLAGASPLLLVPGGPAGALPDRVRAVLDRLDADRRTPVVILGGPAAVSHEIAAALARDRVVSRLAGDTRYTTAVAVAMHLAATGPPDRVLLARGDVAADAVAAGGWAAREGVPVLLSPPAALPRETGEALRSLASPDVTLLGGEAALSARVESQADRRVGDVDRVAGRTRVGTAVAIARQLWRRTAFSSGDAFVVVDGYHDESWALSLLAAPIAAREQAPILYTNGDALGWRPRSRTDPGETGWYLLTLPLVDEPSHLVTRWHGVGGRAWGRSLVVQTSARLALVPPYPPRDVRSASGFRPSSGDPSTITIAASRPEAPPLEAPPGR